MHTMKNTELYRLAGSLSHYARMWGEQVTEAQAKMIALEKHSRGELEEFCSFHRVMPELLLAEIA
jgi:hypothetical protein